MTGVLFWDNLNITIYELLSEGCGITTNMSKTEVNIERQNTRRTSWRPQKRNYIKKFPVKVFVSILVKKSRSVPW